MDSLWMATAAGRTYSRLDADINVDVAVLGGGIAGLTTALLCTRAGLKVAVVDARRIASGVTGSTTGKVTALQEPLYAHLSADQAKAYAQANLGGLKTIEAIVGELGIDCGFEARTAYTYTTDPSRVDGLRAEAQAAREAGLDVELTTDVGLPFDVAIALRLDGQAQFHARAYCLGIAAELTRKGASIFENTTAVDVDESADECVVRTSEDVAVHARDVVVATHVPFGRAGLFFARTRPARSYAIAGPTLAPTPPGIYLDAGDPVRSVRDHSQDGRRWLIVGGESHKTGQDPDTAARFAALRDWTSEHFGIESFEFEWSAQDLLTGDRLPYIGRLSPASRHQWVATGFRKWGMANATAAAEILTARITGREHPLAGAFDPQRAPIATLKRIAGEVADTAKEFVGRRFVGDADPGPGQAAVLRRDGELVAVYVDEGGTRHEVSAVCTHLGCVVAWNGAERSWDCPCHGSRFASDGSVLEGPATAPLSSIDHSRRD